MPKIPPQHDLEPQMVGSDRVVACVGANLTLFWEDLDRLGLPINTRKQTYFVESCDGASTPVCFVIKRLLGIWSSAERCEELLEATRADEEPLGGRSHRVLTTRSHGGAGDAFIESTTPRSYWGTRLYIDDPRRDIIL